MRGSKRRAQAVALPALVVALLFSAACGAFEESLAAPTPTPTHANIVGNSGFDFGALGWQSHEGFAVDIDGEVVRSGAGSLRLAIDGARSATVGQQTQPQEFPEYVSGYFRVDDWASDGVQGVEFAVRVHGGDFEDGLIIHELRVGLGGDIAPFELPEVRHIYVNRDRPPQREWIYFGYPVRQAFETTFGQLPGGWDAIEVVLAVRGAEGARATVWFDDLYAGPLRFNPNRPDD